jgi:hypothetical protein
MMIILNKFLSILTIQESPESFQLSGEITVKKLCLKNNYFLEANFLFASRTFGSD